MKTLKNRIIVLVVCILASIFFLNETGLAGKPAVTTGKVSGRVTDKSTGKIIAGAKVTAFNTSGSYSALTSSKGLYSITLPAGTYDVNCEATGYTTATVAAVAVKIGITTTVNFSLSKYTVTTGTLTGAVTNSVTGAAIKGAVVTTSTGGYTAITDATGKYTIANMLAGTYTATASATGYSPLSKSAVITAGITTTCDFALTAVPTGVSIISLTASPSSFVEKATGTVTLTAVLSGTAVSYAWAQIDGPRVPGSSTSATSAVLDVSLLEVAVDTEIAFRLTVTGSDGKSVSKDVAVFVEPADMFPFLGANVQIGGATTAVNKFMYNGTEWAIFNIGSKLCTTSISPTAGTVYTIYVPGFINDIDLVTYSGQQYALLSIGTEGIVVVNITDPANMMQVSNVFINYYQGGITFTEGGGSILNNNEISDDKAPVAALATDGVDLYIADSGYGIHKTALSNLLGISGPIIEADGTLLIDQEVFTLQYAGENPWGRPVDLKLYGGKLFACLKELGVGIFDTATLQQVGRYNLYADTGVTEDWFIAMNVTQTVQTDSQTGEPFVDEFTGMPDFRQTSFEILQVMKNDVVAPTPWADLDRYGKFYYTAQSIDIAEFNGRTIAYIAYSLGGLIAADITGYQNATATDFMNATYLGYVPAVPANGPSKQTGTQSQSILPYYGAGMLKDAGVVDVQIRGNYVYMTDHFAGLQIIDNAATPDLSWHGPNSPYNNDTDGIPANHWPDYEFITSYDMSPYDPLDNESMPKWMYTTPSLLVTTELNGHGNSLLLMDNMSVNTAGNVDLLECAGAGGFNFVDIVNLTAQTMEERYAVPVYFPTTNEIGAYPDGTAGQTIAIGHSAGIASSSKYVYVSDGPHGISAWKIVDASGYPTDSVHLVANTLQDEYPEIVNGVKIYPASHAANVVYNPATQTAWSLSSSLGLRRVNVSNVEADQGVQGAPLLLPLALTDCFEHNAEWGTVKGLQYQDHAYDVEIKGNYAFVADGSNGLTVYDFTKNPTSSKSGFLVSNIGAGSLQPPLGTASGIALWTDPSTGKSYAFIASGPKGIGVVDITSVTSMRLIKVFEPIKIEDDKVGAADGQSVDVKVVGNYAYFTYDSFGVVCYRLSDLIESLPDGIDPTEVWKKNTTGQLIYDYRPVAVSRYKMKLEPGCDCVEGGAVKLDYTLVNGKLVFYIAYAETGIIKVDWTDPANPVFKEVATTAGFSTAVTISNGRLYAADGSGGLVFFK